MANQITNYLPFFFQQFGLLSLVALPFLASLLAALLPSNARNAVSALAGAVALFCLVQAVS